MPGIKSIPDSQVKSWQRVTGTTSGGNDLVLTISSVNAAKCLVFVEGGQFKKDATPSPFVFMFVPRYVSAFASTSVTLAVSYSPADGTWNNGTFSVIIVEFY